MRYLRAVKIIRDRNKMVVVSGWEENENHCLMGRVSVLQDKKNYGDGWLHNNMNAFNTSDHTLKNG